MSVLVDADALLLVNILRPVDFGDCDFKFFIFLLLLELELMVLDELRRFPVERELSSDRILTSFDYCFLPVTRDGWLRPLWGNIGQP